MIEIKGNLWDFYGRERKPVSDEEAEMTHWYVICITTNGSVRKDGKAVMGRGCAKEAMNKIRGIATELGKAIEKYGNRVLRPYGNDDAYPECMLLTFPVKHRWDEEADLALIVKSAKELATRARGSDFIFVLPRPGCGNGRLRWEDVKPLIKNILPDNVLVISKPGEK